MSAKSATTLFTLAGTIVINIEDAINDIDKVVAKVDTLYDKLQNTSWGGFVQEIDTLDRKVTSAGESFGGLYWSIEESNEKVSSMKQAFDDLDQQVYKTGQTIGGEGNSTFKNIMINVAASAIYDVLLALKDLSVEFAKMGITFNSTDEALIKSFEDISGLDTSKAEALVEKLRDFAKNTPYDINAASNAAYKLLDAGFNDNEVIDQLYMLGEMADNESAKLEELAKIYANVVGFGKVRDSDMEAFAAQGISLAELFGGYLGDETILALSVTNAFKRATSEGGQYYNNMAKTMETWEGQTEKLNEQLNETAGIVTKPFFEELRDYVLPRLGEKLEGFGEYYEDFEGGMEGAARLLGFVLLQLVDVFLLIAEAVTAIASAIGAIVNPPPSDLSYKGSDFDKWTNGAYTEEQLKLLQEYIDVLREIAALQEQIDNGTATIDTEKLYDETGEKLLTLRSQLSTIPYLLESYEQWKEYRTRRDDTYGGEALDVFGLDGMGASLNRSIMNLNASALRGKDNTDVVNALARLESVLLQIESKTGTTQNVVLNTGAIVGALAPQMNARLGVLGSRSARG